jgi:hypothetical protein
MEKAPKKRTARNKELMAEAERTGLIEMGLGTPEKGAAKKERNRKLEQMKKTCACDWLKDDPWNDLYIGMADTFHSFLIKKMDEIDKDFPSNEDFRGKWLATEKVKENARTILISLAAEMFLEGVNE